MTFEEWKQIKKINGEDNKKVIRDFERKYPMLAATFEEKEKEEEDKMRQTMNIGDRMERWKAIAGLEDSDYAEWKARREREVR